MSPRTGSAGTARCGRSATTGSTNTWPPSADGQRSRAHRPTGGWEMSEATGQDELIYRRIHDAPRELLFDCMTTPEHLAHFWGAAGTTTPIEDITVDLRPG